MKKMMSGCGTVAGILGELVCLAAVYGRFNGAPTVMGHKAISIFTVGVGLMVLGCFKKIWCMEKAVCQTAPGK